MAIVGPGATQDKQIDIKPTLDGVSEYEYITVLNPLTDDFAVRVAQDIPVNMPAHIRDKTALIQEEGDVTRNYGFSLRNPDFKSRKHIINDVIIKSGQTINLKGDQAQVAVRQLVNEIAQREGKARLLADPTVRKEIEDKIIINRGSIQDLMDNNLQSPRQQINKAIDQSNEVDNEPEFPGLDKPVAADAEGSGNLTDPDPAPQKRTVGRPKKA